MSGVVDINIRLTNFITKSKQTHETEYDYSKVEYINGDTEVIIVCPIHGEFNQKPNVHVRGSDCPECSKLRQVKPKSTTEKFIEKARKIYGDKYSYDKTDYTLAKNKVIITCSIHGDFEQRANSHLNGFGCYECGKKKVSENNKLSLQEVIDKFKNINEDKYDYSKVIYKNNHTNVEIVCKIHGSFLQTPKSHFYGSGCPNCGVKISQPEQYILSFIKSVYYGEIIQSYRPIWMEGQELDIFIPEYNFAIEYNGTAFHHSSRSQFVNKFYSQKNKSNIYHYKKWKQCRDNNVILLSIYDFYWILESKKEIYKSKIMHYLNLDNRIYARKCELKELNNETAFLFYGDNHIEGKGFAYRNSKSYGLFYDNNLVMCCTIGEIYNQTAKCFKNKLHRICTLRGTTVVGGISKLSKFLLKTYSSFSYQITLSSGGSTLNTTESCKIISPRYFWVNPKNLQYYHRNYCQKHLLEKHFNVSVLKEDTETTYMEKLGFLKVYDNGLAEITFS